LDEILERLRNMPTDESLKWAGRLTMCLGGAGLRESHPEMFDAIDGYRLALIAIQEREE